MTYRSLERANAFFYDPARRSAVIRRHGSVAYLSSGVNHLPTPRVLREIAGRELQERRLLQNYAPPGGSLAVAAAIGFDLRDRLGPLRAPAAGPANICLTVGATGALAAAFHYLAEVASVRTALVLGLNYSFFSAICEEVGIRYSITRSGHHGRLLPTADEACSRIAKEQPSVVVLSQPTNPSGELYSAAELERIVAAVDEAGSWLVFDEVPHLALPSEDELPLPFPPGRPQAFPPRLIWIGSFSKSRSLAGLRAGYMAAPVPVVAYVRKFNERLLWSPANAGSSALVADMVLRCIARRVGRQTGEAADRIATSVARQVGRRIQVSAPYDDDFARLGGIWEFIAAGMDWPGAYRAYATDLDQVRLTCAANWDCFRTGIAAAIAQYIPVQSGFNHCVKFRTGLHEAGFVEAAFEQAGTDFYTETVFADHDDNSGADFWVRISCAVEPATFHAGVERLAAFLAAGRHRR